MEYFNKILDILIGEQIVAGDEGGVNEIVKFEKECMEEWKRDFDFRKENRKGKKRSIEELGGRPLRTYVLEDLVKEFGIEAV